MLPGSVSMVLQRKQKLTASAFRLTFFNDNYQKITFITAWPFWITCCLSVLTDNLCKSLMGGAFFSCIFTQMSLSALPGRRAFILSMIFEARLSAFSLFSPSEYILIIGSVLDFLR